MDKTVMTYIAVINIGVPFSVAVTIHEEPVTLRRPAL